MHKEVSCKECYAVDNFQNEYGKLLDGLCKTLILVLEKSILFLEDSILVGKG